MITIHHSSEVGLETIERPRKGCWVEVTNPTLEEARMLSQDLSIPSDFVTSSCDQDEIPRTEKANGALLILVRIPHVQNASARIPFVTIPIGIIMTDELVVTICPHEHDLLSHLHHEHQEDLSTTKPTRFVLYLLLGVANCYLHHLREIDKIVDSIEDQLERSLQNREILKLLRYQKSLVHFTTALQANELMLERLQREEFLKVEQQDEVLLDDVFTENHQASVMGRIASDILSQMMDAFASIISNNLNVVTKVLAAFALILVVPSIIGTFYGMNVHLPLEDHPSAFPVLVGLSMLSSFVVAFILWKKEWL